MKQTPEVLFTERQHYNQWYVWALMAPVVVLLLIIVVPNLIRNPGNNWQEVLKNLTGIILFSGVLALLIISRLETQIKTDGIYYRYYPYNTKWDYTGWDELDKCYVRKYKSFKEYGGWGVRSKTDGNVVVNVSGNMGLQLEFTGGFKLLIGTKKPDEVTNVLMQLGKLK